MSKKELKESREYLDHEIRELMAFAFSMLGEEGVNTVVQESSKLADGLKTGKLTPAKLMR